MTLLNIDILKQQQNSWSPWERGSYGNFNLLGCTERLPYEWDDPPLLWVVPHTCQLSYQSHQRLMTNNKVAPSCNLLVSAVILLASQDLTNSQGLTQKCYLERGDVWDQ